MARMSGATACAAVALAGTCRLSLTRTQKKRTESRVRPHAQARVKALVQARKHIQTHPTTRTHNHTCSSVGSSSRIASLSTPQNSRDEPSSAPSSCRSVVHTCVPHKHSSLTLCGWTDQNRQRCEAAQFCPQHGFGSCHILEGKQCVSGLCNCVDSACARAEGPRQNVSGEGIRLRQSVSSLSTSWRAKLPVVGGDRQHRHGREVVTT